MKTETEINEICTAYKMVKLIISKFPTWVDEQKQEGIELQNGKVIPFWIVSGERLYDQPSGDKIQKVLSLIQGNDTKLLASGNEVVNTKPESGQNENENGILPDIFTPILMGKWAKMTTVDRMLMFQRTPKDQIFQKPVGAGQTANYVKGNYMIKEANAAFLFDWSFEQQGISIGTESVCVYGVLKANVDGKIYSRPAVGYEEINKKMTAQLAIKSATTDAIKKGLSLFGFNSDVYGGEI